MLKGIPVIIHIVVVVIGIAEKAIATGEDKGRVDGRCGQTGLLWVAEGEDLLWFVVEVTAMFIAQVGGGLFVSDHLEGCFHPDAAVVGGQDDVDLFVRDLSKRLVKRRMFEPAGGNAPVADLVAGQFLEYFHFRAGVAEHVHKVVDDDIEIVVEEVMDIVDQVLDRKSVV